MQKPNPRPKLQMIRVRSAQGHGHWNLMEASLAPALTNVLSRMVHDADSLASAALPVLPDLSRPFHPIRLVQLTLHAQTPTPWPALRWILMRTRVHLEAASFLLRKRTGLALLNHSTAPTTLRPIYPSLQEPPLMTIRALAKR